MIAKLTDNLKWISTALALMFLLQMAVAVPVFADAYTDAQSAVSAAEESNQQEDIDTAQVMVSDLPAGEERAALEARLDILQNKLDAALYEDFSGKDIGDVIKDNDNWNATVQNDPENVRGKVAKNAYQSEAAGGWYAYDLAQPVTGKIVIEQAVRFDCDGQGDRYFQMYYRTADGKDAMLFQIAPENHDNHGVILAYGNSGWSLMPNSKVIQPDSWYDIKIVMDTDTNAYEAYLSHNGSELAAITDGQLYSGGGQDYTMGINQVKYRVSGKLVDTETAGEVNVYYTGLKIRVETPLKAARNAVVKAERSLLQADVDIAENLVAALDENADKTALQARLTTAAKYAPAATAVAKAEQTKLQTDVDSAYAIVNLLDNGAKKTQLLARLEMIETLGGLEAANYLVGLAEESGQQADIDAAQSFVAQLEDDAASNALEARLDALQAKADAVVYADFADKTAGDTFSSGNGNSSAAFVQEDGNMVVKVSLTDQGAGGWGEKMHFSGRIPASTDFTVEQKVKYSGTVENGRIVLYDQGSGNHIFNVAFPAGQVMNSAWAVITPEPPMAADTWYTIRYAVDTQDSQYTILVLNTATGAQLASQTYNYADLKYDASAWQSIDYQFEGTTSDGTGALYVDDLVVTPQTPLKAARDAVVKAERSRIETDIQAAQELVGALDAGADKNALQERLDFLTEEPPAGFLMEVTLKNASGGVVTSLAEATTATVTIHNDTGSTTPVQLIAALYETTDGTNRLAYCQLASPMMLTDGALDTFVVDIPQQAGDNRTLCVWAWDSLTGMKPVHGQGVRVQ